MVRKKENVLIKLRTSRKLYVPFYLMIILMGALLYYLNSKGFQIGDISIIAFLIFAFFVINFTETHRLNNLFEVTPNYVSCIYGIFNKSVKKIDYFAISDIYMKQNFIQWILNYGDVNVSLFSADTTTKIRNINNPKKFVDMIEKMMKKSRSHTRKEDN